VQTRGVISSLKSLFSIKNRPDNNTLLYIPSTVAKAASSNIISGVVEQVLNIGKIQIKTSFGSIILFSQTAKLKPGQNVLLQANQTVDKAINLKVIISEQIRSGNTVGKVNLNSELPSEAYMVFKEHNESLFDKMRNAAFKASEILNFYTKGSNRINPAFDDVIVNKEATFNTLLISKNSLENLSRFGLLQNTLYSGYNFKLHEIRPYSEWKFKIADHILSEDDIVFEDNKIFLQAKFKLAKYANQINIYTALGIFLLQEDVSNFKDVDTKYIDLISLANTKLEQQELELNQKFLDKISHLINHPGLSTANENISLLPNLDQPDILTKIFYYLCLKKQEKNFTSELSNILRESEEIQAISSEVSNWKFSIIPIICGEKIFLARLYFKKEETTDNALTPKLGIRTFTIEINYPQHGLISLFGIFDVDKKRFNLLIESQNKIPGSLNKQITKIFHNENTLQKISGDLYFSINPKGSKSPLTDIVAKYCLKKLKTIELQT
jgi:hypothetical protein